MKQLLAAGANVNAKSPLEITALMAAALEGSPDSGLLLLNSGADKEAKANGKTARDLAKQKGNEQFEAILKSRKPQERFHRDFSSVELSRSPRNGKRELLDSFIFQNSFLIDAEKQDGHPIGLTEDQRNRLTEELQFLLSWAKAASCMIHSALGFRVTLRCKILR